jgi:hypothetical protein
MNRQIAIALLLSLLSMKLVAVRYSRLCNLTTHEITEVAVQAV